jgi:hypothetical protein
MNQHPRPISALCSGISADLHWLHEDVLRGATPQELDKALALIRLRCGNRLREIMRRETELLGRLHRQAPDQG